MAIHLLTVNMELQRVRADFALCESRTALAAMTAERDALLWEHQGAPQRDVG